MDVTFRHYSNDDFEVLTKMVLGQYTKDGLKPTKMSEAKIALTVEKLTSKGSNGQIFIFKKEGETIGYSIINRFWSNEFSGYILYIDELYVVPESRSQGVGAHFFDFLKTNPEYEAIAFMLETVRDNEKAIKFYQKLGFTTHHNHLMFNLPA
ncbi:MAG: GNAT family N-acetyltransferase [Saprospiraceae bacterium]|nr:GNAT family N-acetyltransferase [Saprospiraceae bacterium]MCF8251412.1 GNAT family N-acetyltransferase [Saprospiraceae bacterium]MCF8283057.1 GNAT family N-acetyltransferase [Bacteroidales bacterium]MCF8312686.1 GNAT family N-acetyltransferase [Saprospiraceae bacterium]MCF8441048.1 GNAT family N-acetyltransferase [Saprospiraceae bacterium]